MFTNFPRSLHRFNDLHFWFWSFFFLYNSKLKGKREQKQLDEKKSFVLDAGNEFYVWHGKKVDKDLKEEANFLADQMWTSKTRAPWAENVRAAQGGEPVLFIYKFGVWSSEAQLSGSEETRGNIAKAVFQEIKKPDVGKMFHSEPPMGGRALLDDGQDGSTFIWTVEGTSKTMVPKDQYGQFFSKRSYIIAYNWGNGERWQIYFWQGATSSISDKGTAAGVVIDVNAKMCKNTASQERVPQYLEPKHFLLMFQKEFIVHDGEGPRKPKEETRLYSVRGDQATNTRAFQVALSATNLFSGDVYVLTTPTAITIWNGKGSNAYAKAHAKAITDFLKDDLTVTEVDEGSEPGSFWSAIGGKKEYVTTPFKTLPKVFFCVNEMGEFKAKRLFEGQYCQAELDPTKLSIVDTGVQVWLWIGSKAKPKDKEIGIEVAMEYVAKIPDARPKLKGKWVLEGHEPIEFGVVFQGFKYAGKPVWKVESGTGYLEDLLKTFKVVLTIEELKNKKALPDTVDKSKLEMYLDDKEFNEVFSMTKKEFEAIPKWKQGELRKKAGIF